MESIQERCQLARDAVMPRASKRLIEPGVLLDSWGRPGNRLHPDRHCATCRRIFKPRKSGSRFCSDACSTASQRLDLEAMRHSFDSKIVPIPESGCWMWTGGANDKGYGLYRTRTKTNLPRTVHRLAWIFHKGEIPHGLYVCHKCDVRCCVNPNHLFLGTQRDNLRDMVRKGRGRKPGPRVKRNDY